MTDQGVISTGKNDTSPSVCGTLSLLVLYQTRIYSCSNTVFWIIRSRILVYSALYARYRDHGERREHHGRTGRTRRWTPTVQLHGICLYLLQQKFIPTRSPLYAHCRGTYWIFVVQYQTGKILYGGRGSSSALSKSRYRRDDDRYTHRTRYHISSLWNGASLRYHSTHFQKIPKRKKSLPNRAISPPSRSYRLEGRNRCYAILAHWDDSVLDWIGSQLSHRKVGETQEILRQD